MICAARRGALPWISMKSHWQADRVGISSRAYSYFIFHVFSIAAYSLLLCSILPRTIHFLMCIFSIVYFSLFSLLLLSPLTFSYPTNFLCVPTERATVRRRQTEIVGSIKKNILSVLFSKNETPKHDQKPSFLFNLFFLTIFSHAISFWFITTDHL